MSKTPPGENNSLIHKTLNSPLLFGIIGFGVALVLVVTSTNFIFNNKQDTAKTAQAATFATTDVSNLPINCIAVSQVTAVTTCTFDLQPGQTYTALTVAIGTNTTPAGTCTAPVAPSVVVSCTGVPIGSSVGLSNIMVKVGAGTSTDTNRKIYIFPNNSRFAQANYSFDIAKGGTAPLFRDTTPITIGVSGFKSHIDLIPAAGAYTCTFSARKFQPKSGLDVWTQIATGVAYNPATGCSTTFSKQARGSGLNWSFKTTITKTSVPTQTYDFFDTYVYRFQGAGQASGG